MPFRLAAAAKRALVCATARVNARRWVAALRLGKEGLELGRGEESAAGVVDPATFHAYGRRLALKQLPFFAVQSSFCLPCPLSGFRSPRPR
jgi:hypothetical protein